MANRRLSRVDPDKLLDMLIKAENKLDQTYIDPKSEAKNDARQDKRAQNTTDRPQS